MKKVFAIRPEPGLSKTIARGAALGLPISGIPLSKVKACGWTLPDLSRLDGLLVGSANAIRHGGEKLNALQHLPVLAVGEATAQAARDAGFQIAAMGTGGLQFVLDNHATSFGNLLRLSGEEHVPLSVPDGTTITDRTVYRLGNVDLPAIASEELSKGAIVLLHSAAAGAHFASECDRLGVQKENVALCALGPRILESVNQCWQEVRAAANPNDGDLLALAMEMCQD